MENCQIVFGHILARLFIVGAGELEPLWICSLAISKGKREREREGKTSNSTLSVRYNVIVYKRKLL